MSAYLAGFPEPNEYGAPFAGYVAKARPFANPIAQLKLQLDGILALLRTRDRTLWLHRYAPGKWSLQELLGHMIDTERIFACRALRIARGDTTPLPGFDQDPYVIAAEADQCDSHNLLAEFEYVRRSTILMCTNLPDAAWTRMGQVGGAPMSTRAMIYITLGHAAHHVEVLRERYL